MGETFGFWTVEVTNTVQFECKVKTDAQADMSLHWAHRSLCWFSGQANFIFAPPHDKTNKMTFGHPPSLIRVFAVRMKKPCIECTAKTDQTGRMPRLIWVFAGRTGRFVGFVMLWLISVWRLSDCVNQWWWYRVGGLSNPQESCIHTPHGLC